MAERGKFIVLDGIDGCGKSTVTDYVVKWLHEHRGFVVRTRDPGGTIIGEQIRKILLSKENQGMCANTELLLYIASRAQLVVEEIMPPLELGSDVVCDRFVTSTYAYQGALGHDVEIMRLCHRLFCKNVMPDLLLLLDADPEIAYYRMKATGKVPDRLESREMDYWHDVRNNFLRFSSQFFGDVLHVVDANENLEVVNALVDKVLAASFRSEA